MLPVEARELHLSPDFKGEVNDENRERCRSPGSHVRVVLPTGPPQGKLSPE